MSGDRVLPFGSQPERPKCPVDDDAGRSDGLAGMAFRWVASPLSLVAVALSTAALSTVFWSEPNFDMRRWLFPWMHFIEAHGRFASFRYEFSNYSPPYLYLLSAGTSAMRWLAPETIIRAISVAMLVPGVFLIRGFALKAGWSARQVTVLGLMWLVLPESVLNSLVWGQCDIAYTSLLVACFYCIVQRRPWWAMGLFGAAISFKLQAAFLGPFLLYLLVVGVLRVRHFVMVPLAAALLALPAVIAGRPIGQLATVYSRQADTLSELAMAVSNPWTWLMNAVPTVNSQHGYRLGVALGMALALVAALALVQCMRRFGARDSRESLAVMATLSLLTMPYVLPKMHERYFFAADAFAFILLVIAPKYWPAAVLLQIGTVCSYVPFLLDGRQRWPAVGAVFVTAALAFLLRQLVRRAPPGMNGSAATALA